MKGLTFNLTQCTLRVKGYKGVKWSKKALRKELKNQIKERLKIK